MPITRRFLGLERPALHSAVNYLLERYGARRRVDLSSVLVVVPGRRAGRRLLELLVAAAEERSQMLTPPRIETVGRFPEELYTPRRPFAGQLVQQLAWARVLGGASPAMLGALLPQRPPADDISSWRELGELVRRQHAELAADGLNFHDVARRVSELAGAAERQRWTALAELQDAYHRLLDSLKLWDRQTARLRAIELGECSSGHDIVLLATVDMSVVLRRMLDQVSHRVTALIFAEPGWRSQFDEHGCLIPEAWRGVPLEMDSRQWEVVAGATDQGEAVIKWLADLEGRFSVDEITIGVADEGLVPELDRSLRRSGVPARWGPGTPLVQAPPLRLLAAVADHLERRRFADFAAFVRHPDLEEWLASTPSESDWLSELDRYQSAHLPSRMPEHWLGNRADSQAAQDVSRRVGTLLAPLAGGPRPLTEWTQPLLDMLSAIYADRRMVRTNGEDRPTIRALEYVRRTLDQFESVPAPLVPRLSVSEAIRWLLAAASRETVAGDGGNAIEILGWLELPLDDAPALVVTSLNEGYVPQSVNSDLFLPNALRSALGLLDNARRLARDTYALRVLLGSREVLRCIAARRDRLGDPLVPSRLLFAADSDTAARRALDFFAHRETSRTPEPARDTGGRQRLATPQPVPLEQPLTGLSVTSFRDYLACPYRFYLRHVLGLRAVHDDSRELDAGLFGTLAHDVLRAFGSSDQRASTDPVEIRSALDAELDLRLRLRFGADPLPAVLVQAEQLRLRLKAFAERQAAWAAEGWEIVHAEAGDAQEAQFPVDDLPFTLRGRIDRLDIHAATGRRIVLDYKTSDVARTPGQTHLLNGKWIDLQLPLYRHLSAALPGEEPPELGFILLPKDEAGTRFAIAGWSAAELASADAAACQVVRRVRREEFWPPTQPPPPFSSEFAAICQDRVARRH